ncbi:hypothetical protein [Streptomyces sp. NPDC059166]|uniref:hypothetical protein n=1 Tax=Streptomyces sp. NPDC059166 TaxID=3346752 RepID=UPI0036BDC904
MTYGRAAAPAVAGGLLLTLLLWWAGASVNALHLQGTADVLGGRVAADLEHWLSPWSFELPDAVRWGTGSVSGTGEPAGVNGSRYTALYATGMQIRIITVFAFFLPGALLLVRRLPPVNGRVPAALAAVWGWGMVAGTLAVTVSAPWLIASHGRGSFRFLPQLAGEMTAGRQILVPASLLAAVVTVLVARVTAKGAGDIPRAVVPAGVARLSATAGTVVVALSLFVLSHQSVAAKLQGTYLSGGLLSEPGDLLRQLLLLGAWDWPAGLALDRWLMYRATDVLLLLVVWWALRLLPSLLTRATVPAMAAGAVGATVMGLLAGQSARILMDASDSGMRWGLVQMTSVIGTGVPAALVVGAVAGTTAAVTLRLTAVRMPDGTRAAPESPSPEPAPRA